MAPAPEPQGGTKVGVLTCRTSPSVGYVFGSHQSIGCSFTPYYGARPEHYVGYITRLGVDLGVTNGGVMDWGVVAPTNGMQRWALAGDYAGASGSATIGVGGGFNALVGGSNRSIALQPVSFTGQTGLNVAAGVAGLSLRAAR